MSKVIWELHVEGKESGFERFIHSFDTRQDASGVCRCCEKESGSRIR
jgi:hypothetical protein